MATRTKLPYAEESVFTIPLRNGGFARGVVARASPKGKVLFGYSFGPRLPSTANVPIDDLRAVDSILRLRSGDMGLIQGQWQVCGTIPRWNRSEWPMPDFVRREPISNRVWLVQRSDDDPGRVIMESRTEPDCPLATDSMSGYGAVEIKLTNLIG